MMFLLLRQMENTRTPHNHRCPAATANAVLLLWVLYSILMHARTPEPLRVSPPKGQPFQYIPLLD